MSYIITIIIFFILTVVTQIGGVAYLISMPLRSLTKELIGLRFINSLMWFLVVYVGAWFAVQHFALQGGRNPIPCFGNTSANLMMQSSVYCVLNRNFVRPEVLQIANALANDVDLKFPGTKTVALDGNFPFFDGFPLLPHLSHDDGNKLDLAFYYQDAAGNYAPGRTKSPLGYWAFERPKGHEGDICANANVTFSTRWDMDWFHIFNNDLVLERERTAYAINWLARKGQALGVTKVFVEPHLLTRLGVHGGILRFQGCHAARHDDHIHFQVD